MSEILTRLILFVSIIAGLSLSGCSDTATIKELQIETVHEVFPSATDISKISISRDVQTSGRPGNHIFNEIRDSSGLIGYCIESELKSRSGPFKIRLFLDQELVIQKVIVVSYPWQRGRDVGRYEFTRQFKGKGPEDAFDIGKDIDVMTGATISCRVMSEGIRDAIEILRQIKVNQAEKPERSL